MSMKFTYKNSYAFAPKFEYQYQCNHYPNKNLKVDIILSIIQIIFIYYTILKLDSIYCHKVLVRDIFVMHDSNFPLSFLFTGDHCQCLPMKHGHELITFLYILQS